MKKLLTAIITTIVFVLSLGTNAHALPSEESYNITQQVEKVQIQDKHKVDLISYLNKNKINKPEYDKILQYINEAKIIIGDETNLHNLSNSDKDKLQELIVDALATIDLKAQFTKNEQGIRVLVAYDKKNNVIINVSTMDVINIVSNFNPSMIDLQPIKKNYGSAIVSTLIGIGILTPAYFLWKNKH